MSSSCPHSSVWDPVSGFRPACAVHLAASSASSLFTFIPVPSSCHHCIIHSSSRAYGQVSGAASHPSGGPPSKCITIIIASILWSCTVFQGSLAPRCVFARIHRAIHSPVFDPPFDWVPYCRPPCPFRRFFEKIIHLLGQAPGGGWIHRAPAGSAAVIPSRSPHVLTSLHCRACSYHLFGVLLFKNITLTCIGLLEHGRRKILGLCP
jgi:hypothetical protein